MNQTKLWPFLSLIADNPDSEDEENKAKIILTQSFYEAFRKKNNIIWFFLFTLWPYQGLALLVPGYFCFFLSECIVGGYFLSIKIEIKLVKKTSFIEIYKGKLFTMFVDISLVLSGFGFQVVT